MTTVGIAEGRAHFGDLCRRASAQRERTIVTDHGTPIAVILSPAELADLEDAAAIAENLANPDNGQDFDEFVTDLRAGRARVA
jgi:prevent-host-death family protein